MSPSEREFPRNEPCPCGSGKKYKACCSRKGFKFTVVNGQVMRSVPMTSEAKDVLRKQEERFIKKFGRPPGPEDPIFFDEDAATPMPMNMRGYREAVVEAMKVAGVPDELIYAYNKTGLMLTEEARNLMPDADVEEFEAAVEEFRLLFPDKT